MRLSLFFRASLLLLLCIGVPVAFAKEGVKATVHTPVPASAAEGSVIHVAWSLANEKTGAPFSACDVFIRLVGPSGDTTEAFTECGLDAFTGIYDADPVVPRGGISRIEIGIAGTMTGREGKSRRSDLLLPLTNDPMSD